MMDPHEEEKLGRTCEASMWCARVGRAAGQSLPENPNRSTHSWESKRAPNYRRFS